MATNIRDIAREAGVSVATVSKVLNGYPTISKKTKDRVMQIVKETRFRPNHAAQQLVGQRSMTLGVFLTTGLSHPYFQYILSGMDHSLKTKGYDLIYLAQVSWNRDYSLVRHCQSRNVEGVIVFGFQHGDLNFEELIEAHIPSMFIDMNFNGPRAGNITSENAKAVTEAVLYLSDLNHRRIAFISGNPESLTSGLRLEGYASGLQRLQLPYRPEYIAGSDFTKESGYAAMNKLLSLPERPTAVICCSDIIAIGAMDAIHDAGYAVPEDFSVIGFDDIEIAHIVRPALTTIRQDTFSIGRKTIELLVDMINDEQFPSPTAVVPTELIVRETCGPAKTE